MSRLISPATLICLTTFIAACDPAEAPAAGSTHPTADGAATRPTVSNQTGHADSGVEHHAQRRAALSRDLADLVGLSERLWPDADTDAGLNWLQNGAAGSGIELTQLTPASAIDRDGIEIRPFTIQAEGDWHAIVDWLQAIESSPREFGLRIMSLKRDDDRVVARLHLAILIDRVTALDPIAGRNLAEFDIDALNESTRRVRAELVSIRQAFSELGVETSWSQPIAAMTARLPEAAQPVQFSLKPASRNGNATRFTGRFTLVVPDAGLVPGYVRGVQKQPGFAAAGLESLRRDGDARQRASITFTFVDGIRAAERAPTGLAEAGLE